MTPLCVFQPSSALGCSTHPPAEKQNPQIRYRLAITHTLTYTNRLTITFKHLHAHTHKPSYLHTLSVTDTDTSTAININTHTDTHQSHNHTRTYQHTHTHRSDSGLTWSIWRLTPVQKGPSCGGPPGCIRFVAIKHMHKYNNFPLHSVEGAPDACCCEIVTR